jgi:glycosyltransferase involved in cell wall biosynthesis
MIGDSITAVVVNFRTLELTRRCVESFIAHYPRVPLILIDNGSRDESTDYVREAARSHAHIHAVLNPRNRYHGPSLDQGVRFAETSHVFTLDSDCEVLRGGFLELMHASFDDPATYAVGELRYKNRFGYTYGYDDRAQPNKPGRIPYVHPYAMLLDREKYLGLRRFIHHGAPCIRNMEDASRAGYAVLNFPVHEFVHHLTRGTSASQGYGLVRGVAHRIEFYANALSGWLRRDPTVPVRLRGDEDDEQS